MDATIRTLETAVANGETGAKAALRRAKNRIGEGERAYCLVLVREVIGDREHGSFAAHAAGLRAVLKRHGAAKLGSAKATIRTQSYSMCSSLGFEVETTRSQPHTNERGYSYMIQTSQEGQDEADLLAKISGLWGFRVSRQDSIEVWQEDGEKWDAGMDYGPKGQGPSLAPEDHEVFLAAFLKVETKKRAKRDQQVSSAAPDERVSS